MKNAKFKSYNVKKQNCGSDSAQPPLRELNQLKKE